MKFGGSSTATGGAHEVDTLKDLGNCQFGTPPVMPKRR